MALETAESVLFMEMSLFQSVLIVCTCTTSWCIFYSKSCLVCYSHQLQPQYGPGLQSAGRNLSFLRQAEAYDIFAREILAKFRDAAFFY